MNELLKVSLFLCLTPKSYTTLFHNPDPQSQGCLLNKSAVGHWYWLQVKLRHRHVLPGAFSSVPCDTISIETTLICWYILCLLIWMWPMTVWPIEFGESDVSGFLCPGVKKDWNVWTCLEPPWRKSDFSCCRMRPQREVLEDGPTCEERPDGLSAPEAYTFCPVAAPAANWLQL